MLQGLTTLLRRHGLALAAVLRAGGDLSDLQPCARCNLFGHARIDHGERQPVLAG
jgi:hypothetical protein